MWTGAFGTELKTMMRIAVWMTMAWLALAGTVQAQDRPVVVELFTSQGCSSCPPADELLRKLGGHADVIPLALHIDYWDYIGWKDSFAQPGFTSRQKRYAHVAGRSMVYTPQMIVNGLDDVAGNRPMDVADVIQRHRALPVVVDLTLTRQGKTLLVQAVALAAIKPSDVQLVRYVPEQAVEITRGENAGHALTYSHIVTDWSRVGAWNGAAPLRLEVPVTGSGPVVVLIQETGQGAILAAARLR